MKTEQFSRTMHSDKLQREARSFFYREFGDQISRFAYDEHGNFYVVLKSGEQVGHFSYSDHMATIY